MRTTATWMALGAVGLLATGCQPKTPAPPPAAAAPAAAAPAAAVVPPTAAPEASAVTPETVLAVNQALALAQAFNTRAAADLAAVVKAEKRIRELADQASATAARANAGLGEAERAAATRRVAAARTEVEAAHADITSRLATFRAGAQAQTDAVALAQLQCAQTPEFLASEPCVKLAAEQATLAQTVTNLTTRFATAEAGYQKDRAKLEEASATMALTGR